MARNKQYSEEVIENMLCLWRSGLNYPQIGAKIGKSKGAARSIIRRYMTDEDKIREAGLLSIPKKVEASLVDDVMKGWRAGLTYAEIAEKCDCTRSEVGGIIDRHKDEGERTPKGQHVTHNTVHEKQVPTSLGPMRLEALPIMTAPRPSQSFIGIRFQKCQWIEGNPSSDESCKCGEKTGPGRVYCPPHKDKAKRVNYNEQ